MSELPKCIQDYFDSNGVKDYNLIEYNAYKGRYCISFIKGAQRFFLKWNKQEKIFISYYKSFVKEKRAYFCLSERGISPEIVDNSEFLITKFLDRSKTLRQSFKEQKITCSELIKNAFNLYFRFLDIANTHSFIDNMTLDKIDPKKQYRTYLASILLSGPWKSDNTYKPSFRKKMLKYLLFVFSEIYFAVDFKKIEDDSYSVVHGDFHLNNILVSDSNYYLIDFENINYGNIEIELAYFYAQVKVLNREFDFEEMIYSLACKNNIKVNQKLFRKLCKMFMFGITYNKRFH